MFRRALSLLAALTLLATAAHAQAPGPPTLGDVVTSWARGAWAAPVFCRIDGETVRGIRRVLIGPERNALPGRTQLEIQFVDMDVANAERCFDMIGTEVPNLTGKVKLRFNGTSHAETVQRDFQRALKKDRGFAFDVPDGRLLVEEVSLEPPPPQRIRLRGGKAWLREPRKSSDSGRSLAEFENRRKLELTLETPDGVTWVLPLVLLEMR